MEITALSDKLVLGEFVMNVLIGEAVELFLPWRRLCGAAMESP